MSDDPVRERYSAAAGQALREATDCRFSFLPHAELARVGGSWYDASAEAMLRGNYGPVEDWVRAQAQVAAEQGYELDDLLKLMRLCRRVAIDKEGWVEHQMEAVDEIIDETLQLMKGEVKWNIPDGLQYVSGLSAADRAKAEEEGPAAVPAEPVKEEDRGERRIHKRAYLKLPVRVRGWAGEAVTEVLNTVNVARGGICFLTQREYVEDMKLQVVYPFWEELASEEHEMPAQIVRIEKKPEGNAVAVKFLVDLGSGEPLPGA